jgi:hypothetical protein
MMLVVFHELADSITSVEGKKGLNTLAAPITSHWSGKICDFKSLAITAT